MNTTHTLASVGVGPCGAKCLEAAALVYRLWQLVGEIQAIAGSDDPLDGGIEDELLAYVQAFYVAAGNAAVCADHNAPIMRRHHRRSSAARREAGAAPDARITSKGSKRRSASRGSPGMTDGEGMAPQRETLIRLGDVPKLPWLPPGPKGKPVTKSTVYNWVKRGLESSRLRARCALRRVR